MSQCNAPSARRLAEVEAELAQERARRRAAEAALRQQALVVVALTAPADASEPTDDATTSPPEAPAATPAEDAEARAARKRAQNAERQRRHRLRHPSVTPVRDSVTAAVTMEEGREEIEDPSLPPSSRVTSRPCDRGTLAVVHVTAEHSAREKPPPEAERLPAEVQALREGWQALVVPHGFAPWPARTPKRLLQEALAALERRPLEEWLKVFALVPRSPVCRGELPKRPRVDVVYLLVARSEDDYEPADKLLLGRWSVDPPPPEAPRASAAAPAEALPAQPPTADTPEAHAWGAVLAVLREERRFYALQWLEGLRPVALREGVLLLEVADRFKADWLADHYGGLLRAAGAAVGVTRVEYVLPGGAP